MLNPNLNPNRFVCVVTPIEDLKPRIESRGYGDPGAEGSIFWWDDCWHVVLKKDDDMCGLTVAQLIDDAGGTDHKFDLDTFPGQTFLVQEPLPFPEEPIPADALPATRKEALEDAARCLAEIEIPDGASDGVWAATTNYCNRQVTARDVRLARRALAMPETP